MPMPDDRICPLMAIRGDTAILAELTLQTLRDAQAVEFPKAATWVNTCIRERCTMWDDRAEDCGLKHH